MLEAERRRDVLRRRLLERARGEPDGHRRMRRDLLGPPSRLALEVAVVDDGRDEPIRSASSTSIGSPSSVRWSARPRPTIPMLSRAVRRGIAGDLKRLKERLEA